VLILNGFAVDEEAAVVVEVECVGVPVWGGSLRKWRVASLKKEQIPGMRLEIGRGLELEALELELASGSWPWLVVRPGRVVVEPDGQRSPRSNRDARKAEDRRVDAERIRRS
jgi:hypothetical protein